MQTNLLVTCWSFIVGIVVAMAAPVDPAWLTWLGVGTGAILIAAAVFWARAMFAPRDPARREPDARVMILGALGGALLGYTRYIAANTVPDTKIAEIAIEPGGARVVARGALPDTCRLRFRKTQLLAEDLHLRLIGELDARIAVRDENGAARIGPDGRWLFQLALRPMTTEVVVIRAEDPIGTDYVLDQPLTRITGVKIERGPSRGAVALYRVSNHISSFVRPGRAQSPVTILGRISADPIVYDFKTVLPVTPEFIQYPAGGPFYRVEGGDIQVTVRPEVEGYANFATTEAYGHDIEIVGELTAARAAANPGGFDARRFMQNHNVFGLMSLFPPRDGPPPIRMIAPSNAPPREGHPLVEFSLRLRDDILRVVKQTMLYPQSAFVGGVTLGLRYGLQGVECMFSSQHHHVWTREGKPTIIGRFCEETIAEEFRMAGVNHVLAVSGLHVTILSVMFVGIFSLLRMPRQAYVPIVILILVVFAIITGARPSTLRAVIMNSLFMMTWAYLDQGLRSSVLIGVPVAAFLILLHNPLVIVDPSFTLSFGAILSLGLLTNPCLDLLQQLKGNRFAVAILFVAALTAVAVAHWPLAVSAQFLVPFLAAFAALFYAAGELQRRGLGIPETINYTSIPQTVGAFLAAQLAIQVGMMIPLSAAYFSRWPFAGAYANLIAIPLIGVVVQLGAIGGLLGLIPGIGIYIALLLGAANWVFSSVFLWLAHASAEAFPYPFVRRPGLLFLGAYYLACAWFIWRRPLHEAVARAAERWQIRSGWALRGIAIFAALALGGAMYADLKPARPRDLQITVLSVGYGSSVFVETPGGRRMLIDGGFVEYERGRRNEAVRSILPFLSHRKIRHLDAVILTSPRPERAAGIAQILAHTWVDNLFLPPSLADLRPDESLDQFAARFADARELEPSLVQRAYHDLVGNPAWPRRLALAKELSRRAPSFLNRWGGWTTRAQAVYAGQALFEEKAPGGTFRIEVLNPAPNTPGAREFDNGSLVLRIVYGDFAALVTSDLDYDAAAALVSHLPQTARRCQVLFLPHRGAPPGKSIGEFAPVQRTAVGRSLGELLEAVKPERVVAEWGPPRPVVGMRSRDATIAHEAARQFVSARLGDHALLATDRDLALMFTSDGRSWSVITQAELNRAAGGEDDAVSDLSVGL